MFPRSRRLPLLPARSWADMERPEPVSSAASSSMDKPSVSILPMTIATQDGQPVFTGDRGPEHEFANGAGRMDLPSVSVKRRNALPLIARLAGWGNTFHA